MNKGDIFIDTDGYRVRVISYVISGDNIGALLVCRCDEGLPKRMYHNYLTYLPGYGEIYTTLK